MLLLRVHEIKILFAILLNIEAVTFEKLWRPCKDFEEGFLKPEEIFKLENTRSKIACALKASAYNWSNVFCFFSDTKQCILSYKEVSAASVNEIRNANCLTRITSELLHILFFPLKSCSIGT